MEERLKKCRDCDETKPVELFVRNKTCKDGYDTRCKDCGKLYQDSWYQKNKHLKFNISQEDYQQIITESEGVCTLCEKPPGDKERLCLDHDHATGIVRDMLCHKCNTALGLFGDSSDLMEAAARYVRRHKNTPRKTTPLERDECGRKKRSLKERDKRGHVLTEPNVLPGKRICRSCKHARQIVVRAKKRGVSVPDFDTVANEFYTTLMKEI